MHEHMAGEGGSAQPVCHGCAGGIAERGEIVEREGGSARHRVATSTGAAGAAMANEMHHDRCTNRDGGVHVAVVDHSPGSLMAPDSGQCTRPVAVDKRQIAMADRNRIDGDEYFIVSGSAQLQLLDRQRCAYTAPDGGRSTCQSKGWGIGDDEATVAQHGLVWSVGSTAGVSG